ncbi:UNVERIFIED_CONTAM: hypothetical protein Slati_4178700 [Sesamum latifolium]|uniref:Uncharacterized protein n=1 Tax=Sesamum latifolium TaxID=2727402 RepID=A0AAW2T9P7_9LAMI
MASESKSDPPETFSDLPPESFWVSRDDEQDWVDRNAVMQRKTSLKLGFNRNFTSLSHRPDVVSARNVGRTSVFGLPALPNLVGSTAPRRRRSPAGCCSGAGPNREASQSCRCLNPVRPGSPALGESGSRVVMERKPASRGF